MDWFDQEFQDFKKKMKWGFKDLEFLDEPKVKKTPLRHIKETPTEIIVKMKLPGVTRKDISLKISSNSLDIHAESSSTKEIKGKNSYGAESKRTGYASNFELPALVDHRKAKVAFKDGLLVVKLPKVKRTIRFKLKK